MASIKSPPQWKYQNSFPIIPNRVIALGSPSVFHWSPIPMELLVFNYCNSSEIILPQSLTKVHYSSTPLKLMDFIQCNSSGVIPFQNLNGRDYNATFQDVLDFTQYSSSGGMPFRSLSAFHWTLEIGAPFQDPHVGLHTLHELH